MLKAYADEHVPLAIVRGLRVRGMDVTSVPEAGFQGTDDDSLLQQATDEKRMMLTCDVDFLRRASTLYSENRDFAPIIFWPQQERTIGHVIRTVIRLATTLSYEDASSRVFFV